MTTQFDFAIVGAGMAGASLAAALVLDGARVLLIEAEAQAGYHSTGRSAAFWTESYGGPMVQPLTTASHAFLSQHGLLTERGALTLARTGEAAGLAAFIAEFRALGVRVDALERADLEAAVVQVNQEMERLVRECPGQYLWGYARYKPPRGETA